MSVESREFESDRVSRRTPGGSRLSMRGTTRVLEHWTWPDDDAAGASRAWVDLVLHGATFFRMPDAVNRPVGAARLVERILGRPALAVESTVIRSAVDKRLYVEHPENAFVPPQIQIMICKQSVGEGGETQLLDTWSVLDKIEVEEPALYDLLFDMPRDTWIAGKPHYGPLLALRRGHLVLLYGRTAEGEPSDVMRRFQAWADAEPVIEFRAEPGDVYIVNNHRMLHGRRAFVDSTREFRQLLVTPTAPLPTPSRLLARARRYADAVGIAEPRKRARR